MNPNDSIKFLVESKVHYGFVMAHHKNMEHLVTGHFPAFELDFGRQTNGEKKMAGLVQVSCYGDQPMVCRPGKS